ncbi:MAG TPA: transglycosylase SLT domain-containing protein [Rhodanobacter sp.]
MNNKLLRPGLLATMTLLAACSTVPSQVPHQPAVSIAPKVAIDSPSASYTNKTVAAAQATDMWGQLRSSFAMADCDADPKVLEWARRYTHNPARFESQMQEILPRLAYVQQIATQYDVAGEFVLLPWVESGFQMVSGRRNRPAGIWQIMPVTADSMGLRVNGRYDGRLDVSASAKAVMKLLKAYHDQFHDWRVADYAYNAGEFKIHKLVQQRGMPAESPVIPPWPVQRVTREHLAKLLAIACVVREPARFNVSLPTLSQDEQLVQVSLPRSMPMAQAAHHAGMSVDIMKDLNAAFRSDMIDIGVSPYVMLPAGHVGQFQAAMLNHPTNAATIENSSTSAGTETVPAATVPATSVASTHSPRKTHKVKRGESLWQIAHRYSVDVTQLQRWNHLRGGALKPGQILQLGDVD